MKSYLVNFTLENTIFSIDVKANSKTEAYTKGRKLLARKLFKESNLKRYWCTEL